MNLRTPVLLLILICSSAGVVAQADELACPAVNCDCASLPREAWQDYCTAHELRLKTACRANNNTPTDYCSLHGPAARPLPLALKTEEVPVLAEAEIAPLFQSAATQQWTLRSDFVLLKDKISAVAFKESLSMLKDMDAMLGTAFDQQRQVSLSWLVYDQESKAKSAWKDYGQDAEKFADEAWEYQSLLWEQHDMESTELAKKAYRVVAFKVMRMAGKAYEIAANAYAGAGSYRRAAKTWATASTVSKGVMDKKAGTGGKASHVNFYQYQAASRLHRASYFWALDESEDNMLESLALAQELSGDQGIEQLLVSADEQREEASIE